MIYKRYTTVKPWGLDKVPESGVCIGVLGQGIYIGDKSVRKSVLQSTMEKHGRYIVMSSIDVVFIDVSVYCNYIVIREADA